MENMKSVDAKKDMDRGNHSFIGKMVEGINHQISVSGYNAQLMGSGYELNLTMYT